MFCDCFRFTDVSCQLVNYWKNQVSKSNQLLSWPVIRWSSQLLLRRQCFPLKSVSAFCHDLLTFQGGRDPSPLRNKDLQPRRGTDIKGIDKNLLKISPPWFMMMILTDALMLTVANFSICHLGLTLV